MGHLYDLTDLVDFGQSLDSACGAVAYKLVNSTLETFIQVTPAGQVSVHSITSKSWIGTHEVTFAAYLSDLDPEAASAETLNFVQTLVMENDEVVTVLSDNFLEPIVSSLVREAPIAIFPLSKPFKCYLDDQLELTLEFANPLAIQATSHETDSDGSTVVVAGYEIPMTKGL